MKIYLSIFIFFLSSLKHDVPVASYNFYVDTFDIAVEIELHSADFKNISKIHRLQFEDENLIRYLNSKIFLKINNKSAQFEFCEIIKENEHHTLTANIYVNEKVEDLEIINHAFIHDLANFSNVYYFYQSNKKVRGFRSSADREKISVKF